MVVDATKFGVKAGMPLDLAGPLPPTGVDVEVSGARLGTVTPMCTRDPETDGVCDGEEQDRVEIVVFDPVSRRAIRVLVDDIPEFGETTVMTGRLHRGERTVAAAQRAAGGDFDERRLDVSSGYLLDDETGPRSAPLAFVVAALLAIVAGVIVVGLAGGYLIYRRGGGALPAPATTLGPGERLPLRITGIVRTPTGLEHVREAPAELIRFVLGRQIVATDVRLRPVDAPRPTRRRPSRSMRPRPTRRPRPTTRRRPTRRAPTEVAAADLARSRPDRHDAPRRADRLSAGRRRRASASSSGCRSGQVMAFRGIRPALRVVAGTGPLLLSFEHRGGTRSRRRGTP